MVKQIEQLCGKKDAEGFRKYVLDNRKKLKLSKSCLNSPWTSWTDLANKKGSAGGSSSEALEKCCI